MTSQSHAGKRKRQDAQVKEVEAAVAETIDNLTAEADAEDDEGATTKPTAKRQRGNSSGKQAMLGLVRKTTGNKAGKLTRPS